MRKCGIQLYPSCMEGETKTVFFLEPQFPHGVGLEDLRAAIAFIFKAQVGTCQLFLYQRGYKDGLVTEYPHSVGN
jgi:hypothetical protein